VAAAVPVAVTCVADTNTVGSAVAPNITWLPFTNPLPFRVIAIGPIFSEDGTLELSTGTGLSSVTATEKEAVESKTLTAFTITDAGFGKTAGAA
jgi:hypothetical protein